MEIKRLLSKIILQNKREKAFTALEIELIKDYFSKYTNEPIDIADVEYRLTKYITGNAFGFGSEYAKENRKELRKVGETIHFMEESEIIKAINTPII